MYNNKAMERQGTSTGIIDATLYGYVERSENGGTHSSRVSRLCRCLGRAMELPDTDVHKLELSGLLHDIGKIAIQDHVLNKKEPLTDEEWSEIMKHSEIGYRMLSSAFGIADIAKYVLYHHERFDGSGYPKGLRQEEIPLLSRIIAVVDSYDAMTNQRSYRETLDQDMAIHELLVNRGTQFDPDIVDAFIEKVLRHKI